MCSVLQCYVLQIHLIIIIFAKDIVIFKNSKSCTLVKVPFKESAREFQVSFSFEKVVLLRMHFRKEILQA